MKVKQRTKKQKQLFLKTVSLAVALCFTATTVAWAAPDHTASVSAHSLASEIGRLALDEKLGRVDEVFIPSELHQDSPFIIYLQDAHANLGAQENISKITRTLGKEFKPEAILAEGGSGESDLTELRAFGDQKIKEKATRFWLKEAVLTGAEREAIIGPHEYRFFGVEDKTAYEEGGKYFLETHFKSQSFLSSLKPLLNKNQKIKKERYNKALFHFEELLSKFNSKKELIPLVSLIANEARNLHINRWKYLEIEKFIDLILIELEGGRAERLFEVQKSIDPRKLFEEIELLKGEVKDALFQNDEERAIDQEEQILKTLEALVSLEATPSDYNYFVKHREMIDQYLKSHMSFPRKRESSDHGSPTLSEKNIKFFPKSAPRISASVKDFGDDSALQSAIAFYQSASIRDEKIFENIKDILKTNQIKRAFLVTGGFHSPGITERLRRENIPFVLITPQISDEDNFENYFARVSGKRMSLDDFKKKYSQPDNSSLSQPLPDSAQLIVMREFLDWLRSPQETVIARSVATKQSRLAVILSEAHIFGEERQVLPEKYSRKKRAVKNLRDSSAFGLRMTLFYTNPAISLAFSLTQSIRSEARVDGINKLVKEMASHLHPESERRLGIEDIEVLVFSDQLQLEVVDRYRRNASSIKTFQLTDGDLRYEIYEESEKLHFEAAIRKNGAYFHVQGAEVVIPFDSEDRSRIETIFQKLNERASSRSEPRQGRGWRPRVPGTSRTGRAEARIKFQIVYAKGRAKKEWEKKRSELERQFEILSNIPFEAQNSHWDVVPHSLLNVMVVGEEMRTVLENYGIEVPYNYGGFITDPVETKAVIAMSDAILQDPKGVAEILQQIESQGDSKSVYVEKYLTKELDFDRFDSLTFRNPSRKNDRFSLYRVSAYWDPESQFTLHDKITLTLQLLGSSPDILEWFLGVFKKITSFDGSRIGALKNEILKLRKIQEVKLVLELMDLFPYAQTIYLYRGDGDLTRADDQNSNIRLTDPTYFTTTYATAHSYDEQVVKVEVPIEAIIKLGDDFFFSKSPELIIKEGEFRRLKTRGSRSEARSASQEKRSATDAVRDSLSEEMVKEWAHTKEKEARVKVKADGEMFEYIFQRRGRHHYIRLIDRTQDTEAAYIYFRIERGQGGITRAVLENGDPTFKSVREPDMTPPNKTKLLQSEWALNVDEGYQRRGIGSALLGIALRLAREKNAQWFQVVNAPKPEFFERAGFKREIGTLNLAFNLDQFEATAFLPRLKFQSRSEARPDAERAEGSLGTFQQERSEARTKEEAESPETQIYRILNRVSEFDHPVFHEQAIKDLTQIGQAVVPSMAEILRDKEQPIFLRKIAARTLGQLHQAASEEIHTLKHVLGDIHEDSGLRSKSAEALGKIGHKSAHAKSIVPKLITALKDRDPEIREAAVWALGQIGRPYAEEAIFALEEVFSKDNERSVRAASRKTSESIRNQNSRAEARNNERFVDLNQIIHTYETLLDALEKGRVLVTNSGESPASLQFQSKWGPVDLTYLNSLSHYKGQAGLFYLARDINLAMDRGFLLMDLPRGSFNQQTLNSLSKVRPKELYLKSQFLNWKTYFKTKDELTQRLQDYQGDEGQIKLARKMGINSIFHLYSAFGGRGNPYGWSLIYLTLKDIDRVQEELTQNPKDYQGDEGQIKLIAKFQFGDSKVYSLKNLFILGILRRSEAREEISQPLLPDDLSRSELRDLKVDVTPIKEQQQKTARPKQPSGLKSHSFRKNLPRKSNISISESKVIVNEDDRGSSAENPRLNAAPPGFEPGSTNILPPQNFKNAAVVNFDDLRKNPAFLAQFKHFLEQHGNDPDLQIPILASEFQDELQAEGPILAFFDGINIFIKYKSVQLYTRGRLKIAYQAAPQAVLNQLINSKRSELRIQGFSTRVIAIVGSKQVLSRRDTPEFLAHPEALEAALLLFKWDGIIDRESWFRFTDSRGLFDPTRVKLDQALAQLSLGRAA